jgi:hypothetical protein
MVKAQGKPVFPPIREISWRMVFLAAALCLGLTVVTQGALVVISLGLGLKLGPDLGSAMRSLVGLVSFSGALFLLSCGLAGVAVSWLARRNLVSEPAIGAALVSVGVGGCLAVFSADALVVAAIVALPGAAVAALGGFLWFGGRR